MMNAGSYIINAMNPFVPLESFLRQCMELVNIHVSLMWNKRNPKFVT